MNKNKCNCNHQSHHGGGGFGMGFLMGAAAVFFLGTPKGNTMMKHLMENGFENFSEYLNKDDSTNAGGEDEVSSETVATSPKSSVKRFFKRKK